MLLFHTATVALRLEKNVKRLISNKLGKDGDLDTDAFQRAMLQYRNTPGRDMKYSPAVCMLKYPIRDFILIPTGKNSHQNMWKDTLDAREEVPPQ